MQCWWQSKPLVDTIKISLEVPQLKTELSYDPAVHTWNMTSHSTTNILVQPCLLSTSHNTQETERAFCLPTDEQMKEIGAHAQWNLRLVPSVLVCLCVGMSMWAQMPAEDALELELDIVVSDWPWRGCLLWPLKSSKCWGISPAL